MLNLKKIGWRAFLALKARNDNNNEISFFDVKSLYDTAYAEKAKGRAHFKKYNAVLKKAVKLDALYRQQLENAQKTPYGRAA